MFQKLVTIHDRLSPEEKRYKNREENQSVQSATLKKEELLEMKNKDMDFN